VAPPCGLKCRRAQAPIRSVGVGACVVWRIMGKESVQASTQHTSPTIEPWSPPSLVSASVHGDRLGNAEPVQRRPHLHCFGKGLHRESVASAYDQRRPLWSILPAPRTPLPGNPPGPFVTGPHPLTESLNDVAAKESCFATTIRQILDARLGCSAIQKRQDFQLSWTCEIEYDHEGACGCVLSAGLN
jgi:hypothetical protein